MLIQKLVNIIYYKKADKVIEVTALNSQKAVVNQTKTASNGFNWAIGY